jgi:nitrogen-specific signal transduction histidine kinase
MHSTTTKRSGDWAVDVAVLAGSLVHEIKNPLSTLNINAQLLLEDWKEASGPREQRTVKRLRVIVSEWSGSSAFCSRSCGSPRATS